MGETLRQDEVLVMYESGHTTKEVARQFGLSPSTVMQQITMARRRRRIAQLEVRAEAAEAKVAKLVDALKLYSCEDGCNDCPEQERDRVSCGWTARAALAEIEGEK